MTVVAAPIIPTGNNLESLRELRNLTFLYKYSELLWLFQIIVWLRLVVQMDDLCHRISHLLGDRQPSILVVITKDGNCPYQCVSFAHCLSMKLAYSIASCSFSNVASNCPAKYTRHLIISFIDALTTSALIFVIV